MGDGIPSLGATDPLRRKDADLRLIIEQYQAILKNSDRPKTRKMVELLLARAERQLAAVFLRQAWTAQQFEPSGGAHGLCDP